MKATFHYLTHSAVPPCLHVMFALVARIHEAVLALIVQLNEHAHGAPLAPSERAKLPVFVPGESQEGVTAVHQVTGEQRVGINNGWQSIGHGSRVEVDDKEHLQHKRSQQRSYLIYISFILIH